MGSSFSAASSCSPADEWATPTDPTGLPAMPAAWTDVLIGCHLETHDKMALFSTSRQLAAVVARHSKRLTLTPTAALKDSHRRAFVLGIASQSSNVHLQLVQYSLLVDFKPVWPCITQITLCDVHLNTSVIQTVQLGQLTRLHTLSLTVSTPGIFQHSGRLHVAGLSSIKQAGGMPSLRTLQVGSSIDTDAFRTVQKLSHVFGDRVSHLVLLSAAPDKPTDVLGCWPAVIHMTVPQLGPRCVQPLKDPAAFPRLTHISAGHQVQLKKVDNPQAVAVHGPWGMLELTGVRNWWFIKSLPMQHISCLRIHSGISFKKSKLRAESMEMLQKVEMVELIPTVTANANTRCGLPEDLPVFSIYAESLPPMQHFAWLASKLHCSALRLYSVGPIKPIDVGALFHVPAHVETLWLVDWCLGCSCPWQDLFSNIPPTVTHLVLDGCGCGNSCKSTCLLCTIQQVAPPIGLTKLSVCGCITDVSCGVKRPQGEPLTLGEAIESHWPGVQLTELPDLQPDYSSFKYYLSLGAC